MDIISIIAIILSGYVFFCFGNTIIITHFSGVNNNVILQRLMEQLWFSDALYTTYNSICDYEYANKINWLNACIVIFVPAFNIIWLAVSVYKIIKFYRSKFYRGNI